MNLKSIMLLITLITLSIGAKSQEVNRSFVYFKTAKSDLNLHDKHLLDSIANILLSQKTFTLEIFGHTDGVGGDTMNMILSRQRAAAVLTYLKSRKIDQRNITATKGFGKTLPVKENTTTTGRKFNRRVEIVYSIKKELPIVKKEPEIIIPALKRAADTVIIGPKGTVLHFEDCAFAPLDRKDIQFEFTELYSQGSVDSAGIQTISSQGNCLTSGGMVFIRAFYKGVEIQPKCSIDIAMPADYLDTAMDLYEFDQAGAGPWKLNDEALEFDNKGKTAAGLPGNIKAAKNYYRFRVPTLGGKNCDKVEGVFAKFNPMKRPLKYSNYVFKIPRSLNNGVVIKGKPGFHYISAEKISRRKFFFPPNCLTDINVNAVYFINNKKYVCTKPVSELKPKRFRNVYKIKKKWFVEEGTLAGR